jgi:hypothetical protein
MTVMAFDPRFYGLPDPEDNFCVQAPDGQRFVKPKSRQSINTASAIGDFHE